MTEHDRPSDTRSRSDRRRLLETGGAAGRRRGSLRWRPSGRCGRRDRFDFRNLRRNTMPTWRPDPTFYPSPRSAMQAPAETLAYVVRVNPTGDGRPDAITVVDVDPTSGSYGQLVGEVEMTHPGDELHHFGWNACSSMLCPNAPHPHVERRYLIVPGLGSSRIYIIDTKPDPTRPADRQDDRAGRGGGEDRLRQRAHRPLRTGRHLRQRPRRARRRRAGRHLHARSRHLRRARPLGDRPRRAVPALRLLVAPRLRHPGQQRVGHAEHGRDRGAAGAAARRPVRASPPLLGSAAAPPRADARPGQGASDRPRAAPGPRPDQGLRLRQHRRQSDRPLRLDLPLAPQARRQRREGRLGGAPRSSPSRPSRRRKTSCHRRSSRSRPCRRWSPTSS